MRVYIETEFEQAQKLVISYSDLHRKELMTSIARS